MVTDLVKKKQCRIEVRDGVTAVHAELKCGTEQLRF